MQPGLIGGWAEEVTEVRVQAQSLRERVSPAENPRSGTERRRGDGTGSRLSVGSSVLPLG